VARVVTAWLPDNRRAKAYWSMAAAPKGATLIHRCDESQTFETRLAAGSLFGEERVTGASSTLVPVAEATGLSTGHASRASMIALMPGGTKSRAPN
jgi:hypothetical protein